MVAGAPASSMASPAVRATSARVEAALERKSSAALARGSPASYAAAQKMLAEMERRKQLPASLVHKPPAKPKASATAAQAAADPIESDESELQLPPFVVAKALAAAVLKWHKQTLLAKQLLQASTELRKRQWLVLRQGRANLQVPSMQPDAPVPKSGSRRRSAGRQPVQ